MTPKEIAVLILAVDLLKSKDRNVEAKIVLDLACRFAGFAK
jgi:hypothetical protein